MKTLLALRLKMLYRIILEIGLVRTILVACLLVYGIFQVFAVNNSYIILSVNVLLILSLHISRSDKAFLKMVEMPVHLLFFIEYLILSIPFMLCLLALRAYWELLALPFILLGTTFLNFSIKTQEVRFQSFNIIPAYLFEWRAGLKQSWFILLFAYVGGVVFYQSPAMIVLCTALIIIMLATFYLYGEDKILVQLPQLSPFKFLVFKVRHHVFLSTLAILPLLLIFVVFQPEIWFVAFLLLIINLFMQIFAILQKYAVWYPHGNLQPNMTLYLFYFISFVIPFLMPVGIILFIRAYRKAIKNLSLSI